jgi:hypothetical protein
MKAIGRVDRFRRLRQRPDSPETAWKDCGMNARLSGAALWAKVSLPQSDDIGAYSAGWSPGVADGTGNGGVAAASGAAGVAGAASAGAGNGGSDGVVGGGSLLRGGMGEAAMRGAGAGNSPDGGGSAGGAEACPDDIPSADATRCYMVSSAGAAWRDASDECEARGGALVKVETADEEAFLATLLAVNLWLGASDTAAEDVFVWSDGTPIEFGNWGPQSARSVPWPRLCRETRHGRATVVRSTLR